MFCIPNHQLSHKWFIYGDLNYAITIIWCNWGFNLPGWRHGAQKKKQNLTVQCVNPQPRYIHLKMLFESYSHNNDSICWQVCSACFLISSSDVLWKTSRSFLRYFPQISELYWTQMSTCLCRFPWWSVEARRSASPTSQSERRPAWKRGFVLACQNKSQNQNRDFSWGLMKRRDGLESSVSAKMD